MKLTQAQRENLIFCTRALEALLQFGDYPWAESEADESLEVGLYLLFLDERDADIPTGLYDAFQQRAMNFLRKTEAG